MGVARNKAKQQGVDASIRKRAQLLSAGVAVAVVVSACCLTLWHSSSKQTKVSPKKVDIDEVDWDISSQGELVQELLEVGQKVEKQGPDALPWALTRLGELDRASGDGRDEASRQRRALIEYVRRGVMNDSSVMDGPAVAEELGIVTYGTASYWEDAYATGKYGESFEWFANYSTVSDDGVSFRSMVNALLTSPAAETTTLVLGNGNSNMAQDMVDDGFSVDAIDIAEAVIEKMTSKYPAVRWHVMDSSNLTFAEDKFRLVVEKGMLDAFDASHYDNMTLATLLSLKKVSATNSTFVSMSIAEPARREGELAAAGFFCNAPKKFNQKKKEKDMKSRRLHMYVCRIP